MVNIINEQQENNKQLLNEIETLREQLADKEKEINELKNPGEVSEQEEEAFKQEALVKIDQILVDMRNRFPHCSKNIEQDLRELISKPLRQQFMNVCFQHSLVNSYTIRHEENLEKVIEEIIKKFFEESDLAEELKEKGIVGNQFWLESEKIPYLIKEGGDIWGRPAKDVIIKGIIESKIERIEELEVRVEELEERVEIEVEMNLKALEKSKEWHNRRVFVENMKRDCIMIEQRIENDQLKKKLDAYEKKDKIKQIKRLTKKAKTKASERIQKLKEKVDLIKEDVKQKFDTYILQSN